MTVPDPATPTWRTSSFSEHTECVAVAWPSGRVAVRDSKHRAGPILHFGRIEFAIFLTRTVLSSTLSRA